MKSTIFIILFLLVFVNASSRYQQSMFDSRSHNIIRRETEDYNAALIAAAKDGHEHLVELLIEISTNVSLANINTANRLGDTPLHAAASAGRANIVRLLIQSGAKTSIRNNNGKSPKDLAIEQGFKDIADLLSVSQRACNLYTNSPTDRIIGGEPADFTWMVALGYVDSNLKISFDCGATIISDSFLLTAAHCVKDVRRPVIIRIGTTSLTDDRGIKAEKHYIERIIRHPEYSPTKKKNDIALIQLVKRIYFSDTASPACLHTGLEDADPNVELTVSGWGKTSNQLRVRSDALLKANVQTVPLTQCNSTIWEYNKERDLAAFRDGISDSQYCAHDPNGGSDSCEGDSGGPLQMIQNDLLPAKVVGIVSFGITCGSTFPSIYTRVASYVDWIEAYVWPNDEIIPPLVNLAFEGDIVFPEKPRVSQKANEVYSNLILSIYGEGNNSPAIASAQSEGSQNSFSPSTTRIPYPPTPPPLAPSPAPQCPKGKFGIYPNCDESLPPSQNAFAKPQSVDETTNKIPSEPSIFDYESRRSISRASLGYLKSDYKISFNCEGTIISDSFILTAAHCVETSNRPIVVQLNDAFYEDDASTRKRLIKSIKIHPNYSNKSKINDIALIELTNRIMFTPLMLPASLRSDLTDEDPNIKLTVTVRRLNPSGLNELVTKEFQTVPLPKCNATLLNHNKRAKLAALSNGISDGQYCVLKSNSNDCVEDSGGGLLYVDENSPSATIVGVTSFGIGCNSALPDVHTRVAYYLDWIESIVWPNNEIPIPLKYNIVS